MEFESAHSNTTAKLPILKLAQENGTSVIKMSVPVTAEEKTNKKNDVKARSLLLMALPNEHQLTFSQYNDAKTMFAAIETKFGGNKATKKTQKTLWKQQYENFSASSTESPDSIFNKLQKIVSRLAILGVVITQEDLNLKFLRSLPFEWNTHVVVWMNKAEIETISIDDFTSSTNDVNTTKPAYEVSTVSSNVNTASPQVSTASFSDNAMYAFMVKNPNDSNFLHQNLEQIHEDDLEAMDLKWQLSLLSMRAKRYFQKTGKKIFINANDTAGYDKSNVECFNCHKMGHFSWEYRAPRNKDGQFRNQDNTRKHGNNEDTSSKAMLAIDGVGFDWSDMAEEQCDDLIVKLNQTEFTATTYKRGLVTLEEQLITYRKNEVLFSEEVAVLKREVACKDYEINVLKSEFEKVKQEKEGIEFKIEKFDNASKSLDKLLGSQITNKSKKGMGYNVVPPPYPLIYNQPKKHDLSYSGLDEFKDPEFKSYGSEDKQVSKDTSSFVESLLNIDKETVFLVDKKVELVKPKNHEKPVKKSVRYAEMYRSQSPRGNQRNWNGQKSNQLGSDFVMYNKACFICGSFDHVQINCNHHQRKRIVSRNNYNRVDYDYYAKTTHPSVHRNMTPRAVLLKTGLTPLNTVRPVNTAHPKPTVHSAKSMPRAGNTARSYTGPVNAVRAKGGKPQQDDTGFVDSGCSRHITGNIAYLSDFKEFDRGYVTFGGGAHGGKISSKGTLKTDSLDFEDLPDENHILFKIPRKDNMYSFDMKNIVLKESLTCLVAKATLDESMLWHRRLGHINFKNINNLVKDNLVRGLFSFLTTKDETSEIFKNFIKEIENLMDKKVKIIRSDNGTEFKNKVMDDFCREKGIKREYGVARTPRQNGVAERRNKTLTKATRTMLADSKLPTTF
ncbi:putative ribonuclease H-like domain-containing protein [Tanacetum coccineum]